MAEESTTLGYRAEGIGDAAGKLPTEDNRA